MTRAGTSLFFVLLLALALTPITASSAGSFDILPERAQDLLADLICRTAAGDRESAIARIDELAERIAAEERTATREGRRELTSVLASLATVESRLKRNLAVSRSELLRVAGDTQEGLAYAYRGWAELLKQRGLAREAEQFLHFARLCSNHAQRFRNHEPEDLSGQFTGTSNRLGENIGNGLTNAFRTVSEGIGRVTGASRLTDPKPKREPPLDPWR